MCVFGTEKGDEEGKKIIIINFTQLPKPAVGRIITNQNHLHWVDAGSHFL